MEKEERKLQTRIETVYGIDGEKIGEAKVTYFYNGKIFETVKTEPVDDESVD